MKTTKNSSQERSSDCLVAVEYPASTMNARSKAANGRAFKRMAVSMAEAAEILGISYCSVARLIKRGQLRSSSAFRHKVIPTDELERFLKTSLQ